MRSSHRVAAAAAAIGLLAAWIVPSAASAQGAAGWGEGSWALRGFGVRLETGGDELRGLPLDPPLTASRFTLEDGSGAGLAVEYRATRRLGFEALAILADLEGEFRLRHIDPAGPDEVVRRDVATDLYGIGLNVHLTPGRRFDIYVGPLVALVRYDDFRPRPLAGGARFTADLDDDTATGVTLGADMALGPSGRWAVSGAVRQLWSSVERAESGRELDVDPLIASLGLAYRWGGS